MIGPFKHTSQLMRAAVAHSAIGKNLSAIRVLGVLIDAGGSRGSCYLNDETIIGELGISRATIWRATKALEEAGFLESDRHQAHRGRATTYVLPLDRPRASADATPDCVAPNATLSNPNSVAHSATQSGRKRSNRDGESVAPREQKRCAPRAKALRLGATPSGSEPEKLNHHQNQGPDDDGGSLDREAEGEPEREHKPTTVRDWTMLVIIERDNESVSEAAEEIARLIGADGPGVIAKRLWPAVDPDAMAEDLEERQARLLLAADHADAELRASGDRTAAGKHWGAICNGTSLIRADSEAAAAHHRGYKPLESPYARRTEAPHPDTTDPLAGVTDPWGEPAPAQERAPVPIPASWGPSRIGGFQAYGRALRSLTIEDLEAHRDDPILAAELARRRPAASA